MPRAETLSSPSAVRAKARMGRERSRHLKAHAGHDADDGVQNGISGIKVLDALEGGDAFLADELQAVYQILAVLAQQPLRLAKALSLSPMQTERPTPA